MLHSALQKLQQQWKFNKDVKDKTFLILQRFSQLNNDGDNHLSVNIGERRDKLVTFTKNTHFKIISAMISMQKILCQLNGYLFKPGASVST